MIALPGTNHSIVNSRPTIRKLLLGCGVASSVWYLATDIIGTLRYPGYSWLDQEFSELTAQGWPVRNFMIVLNEFPYNLLVSPSQSVSGTSLPTRAARLAAAMLVGYATTGFITGVVFPMATREAIAADEATLSNTTHPPGTMVMSFFVVLAIAFGSRLLGKPFRYYSYATIAAMVAFGILTSLQVGDMEANTPRRGWGWRSASTSTASCSG